MMRRRWRGVGVAVTVAVLIVLTTVGYDHGPAKQTSIDVDSVTTYSPRLLIRAPSSSVIYLVTQNNCATKFCLGMWRSDSGGAGFYRRTAPPGAEVPGAIAGSLDRMVFANARDGFAVVGESALKLYATTDGARSWHRIMTVPEKEWSGLTVTAHSLFVTTEHCMKRNIVCSDYRVWRSSLAGEDWTELPVLWNTGSAPKDVYYGPSVAAYGNTVWELETAYMAVYLWTSHDNGRTFSRMPEQKLGSVAGCELLPTTVDDLWAQCPTGMQVSFLESSDGGVSWNSVSQHQFFGTGGGSFDPVSSSLAYLDYGVSFGPPNLFRLNGGGEETAVGELKCAESMAFTSERDGLAICERNASDYSLARTTDGGTHWDNEVLWGN